MTSGDIPPLVVEVARQLRRRRLVLGIDDYDALRRALAAGFGWSSDDELRRLCIALWAKSPEDAAVISAAFSHNVTRGWRVSPKERGVRRPDKVDGLQPSPCSDGGEESFPQTLSVGGLADSPPPTGGVDRRLVLVAQYPLTEREIAQAWRGLRRPLRSGPDVELDVQATIRQRARSGVSAEPVLIPRRRNVAKLLLLIDRFGSMTPYHGYVDHVVRAMRQAGRIDDIREAYFHDLPGRASGSSAPSYFENPFRLELDAVLPLIPPMRDGRTYDDPGLTESHSFMTILGRLAEGTSIVVISDAGAARRRFDALRLLDTIALLKTLHYTAGAVAWINPVVPHGWEMSTASQVARYIPMYPLTREGLNRAIDVLRGRPAQVECPL